MSAKADSREMFGETIFLCCQVETIIKNELVKQAPYYYPFLTNNWEKGLNKKEAGN